MNFKSQVIRTAKEKPAPQTPVTQRRAQGAAGNHAMQGRYNSEREVPPQTARKSSVPFVVRGDDLSQANIHESQVAPASNSLDAAVLHTFGTRGLTVPIKAAAETLGASAMTVGGRVNLAPGRFDTKRPEGLTLLGHEIGHALQQSHGPKGDQTISSSRRASLESEAWAAGKALARGQQFIVRGQAPWNVALYAGPTQTDIQQWEDDWNDPTFAAAQNRFKGDDRPAGDKKHRYDTLCPLYFAQGIKRPLQFVHENIVDDLVFFRFTTQGHKDLRAPLRAAQTLLAAAKFDGTDLTKFWGFNARTTSHGKWSNHAAGRAIDIDQETNPHLDNKEQRRVISAVTELDLEAPVPGVDEGMKDTYEGVELASFRFQTRYSEGGLTGAVDRVGELLIDQEMRVGFYRHALKGFPTRGLNSAERALRRELESELKSAQARQADLVKDRKAVEAERRRFRKEEAGVASAEEALTEAEDEQRMLEGDMNAATAKEQRRLAKSLAAATKNTARRGKALETARKKKEANPLGRYAETGFLTLPRLLVEIMKQVGFEWGGELWPEHKDLMHFQLP